MRAGSWIAAIVVVVGLVAPAAAAGDFQVAIAGQVKTPQQLTMDDLRDLPATEVEVSHVTGLGTETGKFSGVLLWTLLEKAGLIEGEGKGALLRRVITVTGRDGYAVVIAAGELAPKFEGKAVILAYARDGGPLKPEEGIRLIVPGDKHAGRSVRDVVSIDVR